MQLNKTLFLIVFAVGAVPPATAQPDSGETAFLEWADMALVPVEVDEVRAWSEDFDRMLGDATVVAIGEKGHGVTEPMLFRNSVFRYLVEEHAFTAIAIESGVVEGRTVHDFVRGGRGEIGDVLAEGINWDFHEFPQNEALVDWMREYNASPSNTRKIDFYGFDIAGWPPAHRSAPRGLRTALDAVIDYLGTVDSSAAASLRERLGPFMPSIHVDWTGGGYSGLSQADRDLITGAITDLVSLIASSEARYTAAGSAADYEWGYRAAIAARQADSLLRQIPVGYARSRSARGAAEYRAFRDGQDDLRDRFQADNLEWVVKQQGPSGKTLVFASNFHLDANPTRPNGDLRDAAGTHLRRAFGERLLTIGNLNGGGEAGCADFYYPMPPPAPGSIGALVGTLDDRSFSLDLRTAPAPVKSWIERRNPTISAPGDFSFRPGAFDVLFYLHEVTPACPR